MCGIAGFVGEGDLRILRRMTDAIRHRGPDAEGHWQEESAGVFLGHRRLSIVDLSGGAQPMWTRDGRLGVTFNGEIYNHAELREELKARGCEFVTDHSDTEVLLHGYREWGDDFVQRLNGMWAFVIYDRERRRLFGSRDRFGKKPLYYFHEGDTFGWASELPALLQHPSCPRNLDALSLRKYFAYCYIPAPRSIYERVWKLPGGHSFALELGRDFLPQPGSTGGPPVLAGGSPDGPHVPAAPLRSKAGPLHEASAGAGSLPPEEIDAALLRTTDVSSTCDVPGEPPGTTGQRPVLPTKSRLRVWRYWEFVLEPNDALLSHSGTDDLCEELRATLERAVRRRLMSDVPLGVFLSGGIDSSAIAALAAKHVPPGQLNTFSIGFHEASFDESSYARLVAERLGTRHREEVLDLDKSLALLPEIIAALDEPLGDGSLLPTYLLSRFTRQHVTVALGGDGGDELFAGYDPFKALRKAEHYAQLMPRPVHEAIRLVAARLPVSHANLSLDFKIKRTLMGLSYPPQLWNPVWMSALEPRELTELFREPIREEELYSEAIESWDRCRQPNLVDRSLQFWTNLYLQDGILAKVDRASMMCSLEARSPFLDLEVADLARRIPWQLKLRGGQTKWILKQALAPLLPKEIVQRRKKGFGMPIGRWLREGKFEFDHARTFPHLDVAFAERKHASHLRGKTDERLFLWCYWLLGEWLRRGWVNPVESPELRRRTN
ncbi:MAG TPA: asparagine synthase (glutamine-hydrolyzing) [Chthoniobacteraceae bacterium]|jgi:asparagine synthase (glutamine-hydrolysing)